MKYKKYKICFDKLFNHSIVKTVIKRITNNQLVSINLA